MVCAGYLAPKHIDPRFLDPTHVFKELSGEGAAGKSPEEIAKAKADALFEHLGSKRSRNRDGYEETGSLLYRHAPVAEFIQAASPIKGLLLYSLPPSLSLSLSLSVSQSVSLSLTLNLNNSFEHVGFG